MIIILVFSLISLGASFLTYWLAGFFNQSPWFLFLLLAFFVGYIAIFFAIYWFGLILLAQKYKGKETKKVNKFYLFHIKYLSAFTLVVNLIFVKQKGLKQIPKKPCLILFNHSSNYDFMTLYKNLKGKYAFIGKKELMYRPMTGVLSSAMGTLFVDRGNKESGHQLVDDAVNYITNQNTSVVIAPEGTRSRNGELNPFKHGGFHIALRSKCPIVMVYIKGMEKARHKPKLKVAVVEDVVLKIIEAKDYENMSAAELASYCENTYREFIKENE